MKLLILAFILCASGFATAHNWEDVSNRELLDELSYRLRGGPTQEQWVGKIALSCDGDDLEVNLITKDGDVFYKEIDLANSIQCEEEKTSISANGRATLYETKSFALCDDDDLYIMKIDPTNQSIDVSYKRDAGDRLDCVNLRNAINSDK